MLSIYEGLVRSGAENWDRWRWAPWFDRGGEADFGMLGIERLAANHTAGYVFRIEL